MLCIGLDLHWMVSVICILDESGQEASMKTIRGRWDILLDELWKIKKPFRICFEASYGYGFMYDSLNAIPHCKEIVVAHPAKIRKSKRKNDRIDARKLAELLFFNRVAAVHVPSVDVRAWRGLIVHRSILVHDRGGEKCRMRALLRANGIVPVKGLWSRKGLAWLATVEFPDSAFATRRDLVLMQIHNLTAMIDRIHKELNAIARKHPAVSLIMSIPGIGIRTAEALVAHIDDPARFRNAKTVGAYFGLTPCFDESAGKGRYGHITRDGATHVRRLVTEASWIAIRRCPEIRARFDRVVRNEPSRKRIALIAVANYLVRVAQAILHSGKPWDPARVLRAAG